MKFKKWITIGLILLSSVFCFGASSDYKVTNDGTIYSYDLITKGPWIDIRSFGAKGDGITDDTAAIQAAINSVPVAGGKIFFPKGVYIITTSINVTDRVDLTFEGLGRNGVSVIQGGTTGTPIFDLSGARRIKFKDIQILGIAGATSPSCGVLQARSTTAPDSGFNEYDNVSIHGYYTQAALVSYDSETNTYIHTTISNLTANAYGYYVTDTNSMGVTSPYKTLMSSSNTNVGTFIGGNIGAEGAGGIPIWIETAVGLRFFGTLLHSGSTTEAVRLDGGVTSQDIQFIGVRHEGAGNNPTSFIHQRTLEAADIMIHGLICQATTNIWLGDAGTALRRADFKGIDTAFITYLYDGPTLRESIIQCDERAIRATTYAGSNIFIDAGTVTVPSGATIDYAVNLNLRYGLSLNDSSMLKVLGISGTANKAKNLRGSATFAAGTSVAVTFPVDAEDDASYYIVVTGNANRTYWITSKLTTGFTINASASCSDVVDWILIR